MLLAKVVGTVVATRKDPRLVSNKLLVARPVDPRGKAEGSYLVAVDTVDAGVGDEQVGAAAQDAHGQTARLRPRHRLERGGLVRGLDEEAGRAADAERAERGEGDVRQG